MRILIVEDDDWTVPRGAFLVVLSVGYTPEQLFSLAVKFSGKIWGYADDGNQLPHGRLASASETEILLGKPPFQ